MKTDITKKLLVPVVVATVATVVSLGMAGCKDKGTDSAEHPDKEHPTEEQTKQTEHPEHPEHPTEEKPSTGSEAK